MRFRQSLELIVYKAYVDMKAEGARSYLGLLWWLVEPVLYLFAFYILFVLILGRGGPEFVPMFLCGAIVWKWFDSGLKGSALAILGQYGLMQQVYVPKYVFPSISVLASCLRFAPVFLIFLVFLLLYGIPPKATWLAVPLILAVQLCLILSCALLIGAITPFLPDLRLVMDNGMLFLFFVSGVFFDINTVQEPLRGYLLLNPMAGLIQEYRHVLISGIWPDLQRLGAILLASLAIGAAGLALLRHWDDRYAKARF